MKRADLGRDLEEVRFSGAILRIAVTVRPRRLTAVVTAPWPAVVFQTGEREATVVRNVVRRRIGATEVAAESAVTPLCMRRRGGKDESEREERCSTELLSQFHEGSHSAPSLREKIHRRKRGDPRRSLQR